VIEAQRVDFLLVPVQDRDRAERFYADVLGLQRSPESGERWVEYETGNLTLALVDPQMFGREFSPLVALAIRVPDVDAAKKRLEEAGVEVQDMFDSGVCFGAGFKDTEGNGLLLHHRYAPFSDGRTP
jgi:predicted enzyme related to lactoylglutathione lyase